MRLVKKERATSFLDSVIMVGLSLCIVLVPRLIELAPQR